MNGVEEILTLQEIMLLRLQEVLRVKNFSLPVKQKIKETLLAILELDIEELKKKIESIDIVLENENILEKEFISAIEYEKQELKRYLQEYGEDEVTQQWQEELRVVTIDDYREVLEGEKKQYEEHIAMHNQKILEITQQSQSIEWLESFALKRYDFTDVEFLAMWKEQMLVTIQHHLLNVRDETKLPSTLYYSFHKEDEEIYGKNH